jgi:hypothetical protein
MDTKVLWAALAGFLLGVFSQEDVSLRPRGFQIVAYHAKGTPGIVRLVERVGDQEWSIVLNGGEPIRLGVPYCWTIHPVADTWDVSYSGFGLGEAIGDYLTVVDYGH